MLIDFFHVVVGCDVAHGSTGSRTFRDCWLSADQLGPSSCAGELNHLLR